MDINQYSEQYFKFLTENFVNNITAQISQRVIENVNTLVNQFDIRAVIDNKVAETVNNAIDKYKTADLNGAQAVGQNMVENFRSQSQRYLDTVTEQIKSQVLDDFKNKLYAFDVNSLVRSHADTIIKSAVANATLNFPDRSIPGSAIDFNQVQIRAENILPGVIQKFTSSGIEDLSSHCQLTITDQYTILENKLVSQDLEIRGRLSFSGSIDSNFTDLIAGLAVAKIEATYGDGTFDQYVHRVLTKLDEEGIDATKIRVQGRPLVENSSLNNTITSSNLRKVGLLSELEVAGEVLFDDTLYVRGGKVGVNTIEPEHALDIWDQEVQLVVTKKQKDSMFLGTAKNQSLVLGTAGKEQLILEPNGSITVSKLKVGLTSQSSAAWQPTDNRQLGEIVWNEQPSVGAPIGWVSLGGARWAKFGIITE